MDTKFPVSVWRQNVGAPGSKKNSKPSDPKIAALIKKSTIKKNQVFRLRTNDKIGSRLAHPRDLHKVTSQFYTIRKYVRYYYENKKRKLK